MVIQSLGNPSVEETLKAAGPQKRKFETKTSDNAWASRTISKTAIQEGKTQTKHRRVWLHGLTASLDLISWLFLLGLMCLQVMNVFIPTFSTLSIVEIGERPHNTPLTRIPGNNDDAYIDRAMGCLLVGRIYKAVTLVDALQDASVVRHPNRTADSYTVLVRYDPQTTLAGTFAAFDGVCTAIALTIDGIVHACADQGYVPTNDSLKLNIGIDADYTTEIKNALPIIILPYWDNAVIARYGIPGQDGVMCSVKLYNQYVGPGTFYQVNVINRDDYDSHTRLWLREAHGTWQNGWYTFPDNKTQFYSHMANDLRPKDLPNGLGIESTVYDALTMEKVNCKSNQCQNVESKLWDGILSHNASEVWSECVNIQDKNRMGLLWYSVEHEYLLSNQFGWSVILANLSVLGLLARWGIAFLALWRGYLRGTMTDWYGCGIGVASCSKSFVLLPILLYPNFKFLCLCFWASCIQFEGDLQAIGDAWNIMYPAIAQFVLVYFALVNWISKCLRLRTSDRTFGPVLFALCIGHLCRHSTFDVFGPSMGFIARAETLFLASSFPTSKMTDVLFTDALVIGGNVKAIFMSKLVLLSLPLIDLILFSERVGPSCKYKAPKEIAIETALAISANYCGGLGKSTMYTASGVNGYEVIRLGYILYGPNNLISFNDYYVVVSCYFSNIVNETYNQRILVLDMSESPVSFTRTLFHWNHPRFVFWWYNIQSLDLE